MATLGNVAFGVGLSKVLNGAKIHSGVATYDHLGSSSTEQQQRVADELNDVVREFFRENPILLAKMATLTRVVDTTNQYAVPTDLRGIDVLELRIEDNYITGETVACEFIEREAFLEFPETQVPQNLIGDFRWSWNDDGENIIFYPSVPTGAVVRMYYCRNHTDVTEANIGAPAAVTIEDLPVFSQRYIELMLAYRIGETINPEMSDVVKAKAQDELKKIQRELTGYPGKLRHTAIVDNQHMMEKLHDDYYDYT